MTNRLRAKCADKPAMIRMAQQIAAKEGNTQYLSPRYYGLDFTEGPTTTGYLRIEPSGEVWQHSRWETRLGPDGLVPPKRLA